METSTGELERHVAPGPSRLSRNVEAGLDFVSRHWLWVVNGFWALFLLGSVLAPLFMAIGWQSAADVIYKVYSFTCHQLPERSFFLFGEDAFFSMYELPTLVAAGADATNLLTLREFVGNPEIGWKLGFSDRMVGMYGGAFVAGIIYWAMAKRGYARPLPIWLVLVMILPMALDGTSHLLSELTGLGFRETNAWATPFFSNQPESFFTGTTFGTLNSTLRLVTGTLFGLGMMLFAYPYMDLGFDDLHGEVERIQRARAQ